MKNFLNSQKYQLHDPSAPSAQQKASHGTCLGKLPGEKEAHEAIQRYASYKGAGYS